MTRPLWSLLERCASDAPDDVGYVVRADDGMRTELTWRALRDDALVRAARMRVAGLQPGGRLLVALDHGADLVTTLWAGIASGASIACFHYLSSRRQADAHARQIEALSRVAPLDLVVTPSWFGERLAPLRTLAPEDFDGEDSPLVPARAAGPEAEAVVFFSGGTTGASKAIPQTHTAVLTQLAMLAERFSIVRGEHHAYWVPLSHDMGMNLAFLMPAFAATRCTLTSPFSWARSPGRFMRLLGDERVLLTAMPNFALDHTVQNARAADLDALDLAQLRHLVCASEPVREASLARFRATFAPLGMRADCILVGYGMAEATCGLTTTPPGSLRVDRVARPSLEQGRAAVAPDGVPIVSCGVPLAGVRIDIVDEQGAALPERTVGEIAAHSPSLMRGYLDATAGERGDSRERGDFLPDGRYLTGDLGYSAEGELFVCGRRRDIIIAAGRNIHPQDVEDAAASVDGIRPRGAVAFGVEDARRGTEGIVVVAELERGVDDERAAAIAGEVRSRVEAAVGASLMDVRLISRRGWIERGASGKVARARNRRKYLDLVDAGRSAGGGEGGGAAVVPQP